MTSIREHEVVTEVALQARSPEPFAGVLTADEHQAFTAAMTRGAAAMRDRIFWHVNSTARGGGVAEMLGSLLPYLRASGIDARWLVVRGDPAFFGVTKRIHNNLHGEPGDGGDLGEAEARVYADALRANLERIAAVVRPGDVVMLHDPQTAGLVEGLVDAGAAVAWRSHIGRDEPNDVSRRAVRFLEPFVAAADAFVFSRQAFVWPSLPAGAVHVLPPSIDPFSAKNQDMDDATATAVLAAAGLTDATPAGPAVFGRADGSRAEVSHRARMCDGGAPPPPEARLVVQVSRWDHLKDPVGVIDGFARHVAERTDAHLVVAGPSADGVADDPEAAAVLRAACDLWRRLPAPVRARVHLAALPMDDLEENAAIVNALQRRATVVVQKSIAEGFGLTVAEAMYKARPVVASAIGGIQDQIVDGDSGFLVAPDDLRAYGDAVVRLLHDGALARRVGDRARARVRTLFLDPVHLLRHVDVVQTVLARSSRRGV